LLGFAFHNLTLPNGKIRYGNFEVKVFAPPLVTVPSGPLSGDVLNFSIIEPKSFVPKGNQFIPILSDKINYNDDVYYPDDEDGCDVYIDGLRHFPENTSCVKLVAKIVTS
jgi:hypothetical protein